MQNAIEVAQAAGIALHAKGARQWACCPLHGEKTPSLCFFPDGRWYCFGCHQHGDAADLYAALHGVSIGEALRALKGNQWRRSPPRKPSLQETIEAWKDKQWAAACAEVHLSTAVMETAATETAFRNAAESKAQANDYLNLLECATPKLLMTMYLEDKSNDERLRSAKS